MQPMGLNEIREKYLAFFESKAHLRLPSFSLIPQNEKSLLLINAGMAPLKPWFSGEEAPPAPRVTTCQKCIRVIDIERIGKTARHGTFFEMLGNFSFGDYFKREACAWAWEFCTEVLALPKDRLHISVYLDDDEAYDIWTKEIGIAEDHMTRMGKEDNFWEIGVGPCGPCSELYFDRGEAAGCGSPDCKVGCDCDRFVEFWNLVFTQFNNDGQNNYTLLPQKNIDTGMGLERIAAILQGVGGLFEVDTIRNILRHAEQASGIPYGQNEKSDVSLRIITDHIRSSVMLVCDGVLPSNEGRGYVMRRLLRRAARHGRLLGITRPFLFELAETVIQESGNAYPALLEKKDFILRVLRTEEERFLHTIDEGLHIASSRIDALRAAGETVFPGEDAFRLYDTFGFPVDLTIELLAETDMTLDQAGFDACMDAQRSRARAARAAAGDFGWSSSAFSGVDTPTLFVGYDNLSNNTRIAYLFVDEEQRGTVSAGETAVFVLDATPFYAESGGQIGDIGTLTANNGALAQITDVKKTADGKWLHYGNVVSGAFQSGAAVRTNVDAAHRLAVSRAHSATHLLHAALRTVLGTHIEQAGSLVSADTLRFDFSHFQAVSAEECRQIEALVNSSILDGLDIAIAEMPLDAARKAGAAALFGEKYGQVVRTVRMGDVSFELCGGTHLCNTARVGLFRFVSEGSVAAGVRRIEACTGTKVLSLLDDADQALAEAAACCKATRNTLPQRIAQLTEELAATRDALSVYAVQSVGQAVRDALQAPVDLGGVSYIQLSLQDVSSDAVRKLGDDLKSRPDALTALFVLTGADKIQFFAISTKAAIAAGLHAGNFIRAVAALAGGNGGGRPDSASAGGKDPCTADTVLAQAPGIAQSMLR